MVSGVSLTEDIHTCIVIIGTRTFWLPVTVTLQDGVISYVESAAAQRTFSPPLPLEGGEAPTPLGTLNLQHSNTVTKPMVRYYDRSVWGGEWG